MNSFDSKINDLVDVIKTSQQMLLNTQRQQQLQQQEYHQQQQVQRQQLELQHHQLQQVQQSQLQIGPNGHDPRFDSRIPLKRRISSSLFSSKSLDEEGYKRQKVDENNLPEDFRDTILSLDEAKELFLFFDSNITPQLFGFEISKFSVDRIWKSSPILICAICVISAMHHPNESLSQKQLVLLKYLHGLCSELLYQGRPDNELDGFNTILALIFCSFWLSDSQMFTGLALQIAKEIGLNNPKSSRKSKEALNSKDRLKLWYLLYILDGQQSLTYNRQPLVDSHEYSLQNSRTLLLNNDKTLTNGTSKAPDLLKNSEDKDNLSAEQQVQIRPNLRFTDMRLVSQVEYNQALSEAFKGLAWDLLTPSSLGIPSKSNLELDKWMVSWTVLLAPMNNGAVWSSKSTLIYYNFAKMHINSSAVRQLQIENPGSNSSFPKLSQVNFRPSNTEPSASQEVSGQKESRDWEDESSDDDDEDEFVSNKHLISKDEASVNADIAFNAALTVLNLVLNDKDIISNLKYVPVHVHIMLYYACLLLVGDANCTSTKGTNELDHFKKVIVNLATVSSMRQTISENFPVDKYFGRRLLSSLDELIEERTRGLKEYLSNSVLENVVRDKFLNQLTSISSGDTSHKFEVFEDNSRSSSPGVIYAWPGSNHGHPSQA